MMDTLDAITSGKYPKQSWRAYLKPCAVRILCADLETVSVQASRSHYCEPRNDFGPYSEVEVGYPSMRPPNSWERYYDGEWQHPNITIKLGPRFRIVFPTGSLRRIWKEREMVWFTFVEGVKSEKVKWETVKDFWIGFRWLYRALLERYGVRGMWGSPHRFIPFLIGGFPVLCANIRLAKGRWGSFRHWTSMVDNACDGVYACVPIELVREFIDSHGGEFKWALM